MIEVLRVTKWRAATRTALAWLGNDKLERHCYLSFSFDTKQDVIYNSFNKYIYVTHIGLFLFQDQQVW